MGKYLKAIILILFCASPAFAGTQVFMQMLSEGVCAESYNPGWTSDIATRGVGEAISVDYYGMLYTPTSTECVCKVLVYNEQIDGTLTSSHDYYMVFFELTGNNATSIMDTSEKVDGDGLSNDTWVTFTFSSCVNLTGSTQYGIGIFVDTDVSVADIYTSV